MANTCEVPSQLSEDFKKFTLSKKFNCGIVYKIDKNALRVELDSNYEDSSIETIAADLPESAPRYIAYSYKWTHSDGRVSYPLVLIFYCPPNTNTVLNMLYSSTKTKLVKDFSIMKAFDIQDSEELTEDWLKDKLAKGK